MTENRQSLKQPAMVALAALVVLLVGAVVFYKERVFFGDASFVVFNVLNYKRFYIQEHRLGSFITQMVPLLGQKMHLPIKTILISYSVSFNLFYLSVAALLTFQFRQYTLAIVMALYYFLFVTASYFWTNNEIHQAVAWMFLLMGATHYMGKRNVHMAVVSLFFFLLALIAVFTHFLVIIPVVYLWAYFLLDRSSWPYSSRSTIVLCCLLAAVVVVKFVFSMNQPYDGSVLHGVTHFSIKDVLRTWRTPVIKMFVIRCFTLYWPALIIGVLGIVSLIKTKQKQLLIWTLISLVGYCIIMGLTYGGYDSSFALFHIESEWMPLSVIVATPFAHSYLPGIKTKHAVLLLCLLFVIRIGYIGAALPSFSWRTDFKEKVFRQMKKKGITKLAFYEDKDLRSKLLLDWSVPDECILMSAMNGDKPQRIFCFVNPADTPALRALAKPACIAISFDMLVPENLNRAYYDIDTSRPYTVTSYEAFMK